MGQLVMKMVLYLKEKLLNKMCIRDSNINDIKNYIDKHYYKMNFTLDEIRDTYKFNETCQDTVPQAIMAFLESTSFEDAIRNAISLSLIHIFRFELKRHFS